MLSVFNLIVIIIIGGSFVEPIDSGPSYRQSWVAIENLTWSNVINFLNDHQSSIVSALTETDLSAKCRLSLDQYRQGILRFELSSIQRLDSSGKWPSGVLAGTFTDLGSFDSCTALESSQYCVLYTNVPLFNETGYEGFMRPYDKRAFTFKTEPFRYFSRYIHFLRRMNITTGLCVPDQCNREELTSLVNKIYSETGTGLTGEVNLCYNRQKADKWRTSEAIGFSVVVCVLLLNLIGNWTSKDSLLSAFNWSANAKKLFTVKTDSSGSSSTADSLTFLDGIKVFTMGLVVLSHFQMGNMFNLFSSSFHFTEVVANPTFILVFMAPYNVDLFLMITGLLMGTHFFSGKRKFHLAPYILGRWIRFASILAWVICLQFLFFGNHFRSYFGGPMWSDYNAIGSIVESCERTWFPTLLLNQFWFDSSEDVNVCLLFDWYLAADFWLSLMFIFVLIPFIRNHKRITLALTLLLIFVGLLASGVGIYTLEIPTTWISTNFQRKPFLEYNFDFNLKPWPHMSPYFVGVLFGYILSKPKLKLSKFTYTMGWLICLTCLSVNLVYEYMVNRFGVDPEYSIALTYGIVSKTTWSLGWAWLILILKMGHLRPIANFFSSPRFRVLSRINLSVLCTNIMVIRLRSGSMRNLVYPSYSEVVLFTYLPIYLIIYSLSMLTTLLIEFPTVNLLKKLFAGSASKTMQPAPEATLINNNLNKPVVATNLVTNNNS